MRLLVVSNMYPSARAPHYGIFIDNYVRCLSAEEDVDVRVVAISDPAKGALRTPTKYAGFTARLLRTWAAFRPEVVHCHYAIPSGLPVAALARLASTPYVLTVHGGDVYEMPRRLPLGKRTLRWVVQGAQHVVAVGAQLGADLRSAVGARLPPLSVINMGVDLERFTPPEDAARHVERLAYVGLLIERKGVDLLLEALARLKGDSTTVDLFGDGPLALPLRARARRLEIEDRVRLHGAVPQEQLPRRLAECGVLVVPSRREPLGLVALEGMAMGMIVVAARVGGLAELVDDGRNGLLFAPEDPAALAEALMRVRQLTQDKQTAMQTAAAATARESSVRVQAAKHLELLRAAAASSHR